MDCKSVEVTNWVLETGIVLRSLGTAAGTAAASRGTLEEKCRRHFVMETKWETFILDNLV